MFFDVVRFLFVKVAGKLGFVVTTLEFSDIFLSDFLPHVSEISEVYIWAGIRVSDL